MTVHDFAGLANRTSARDRWIALGGPSGSGKSTLAEWLLATHDGWRGPVLEVVTRPLDFGTAFALTTPHIVLVDEIVTLGQLAQAACLLARHRLVVATHLPAVAWSPLRLRARGRFVSTAQSAEAKIAHALAQRGLAFSDDAVRRYVRWFGPVYSEIDIVLERCPSDDFDRALARFAKFHRLARQPAATIRSEVRPGVAQR